MRRFYTNGEIELIAEGYRLGTPVADLARILDRSHCTTRSARRVVMSRPATRRE